MATAHRSRPLPLLLAVALLAAAPASRAQTPRLEARRGGLWLTALPPLLAEESIERQLTSGLTTSFVFTLDVESRTLGAAQIDVRYELWDEVFLLARLDADAEHPARESMDSRAALNRWWAELSLRLGDFSAQAAAATAEGEVHLVVVPFSQDEETETRLWFAESVRRAEGTASAEGGTVGGASGLDRVLTTLLGTSIRRRPLVEYRWQVEMPHSEEAEPP